jgi:hypothetical protein
MCSILGCGFSNDFGGPGSGCCAQGIASQQGFNTKNTENHEGARRDIVRIVVQKPDRSGCHGMLVMFEITNPLAHIMTKRQGKGQAAGLKAIVSGDDNSCGQRCEPRSATTWRRR